MRVLASALMALCCGALSQGQSVNIPVANAGFEDFDDCNGDGVADGPLPDGCITRQACSTCSGCQCIVPDPIPCWVVSSPGGHGTSNPDANLYPSEAGEVPEGQNIAWFGTSLRITQHVPEVLTAGNRYTLRVKVGRGATTGYGGHRVALIAGQGGSQQLIAETQEGLSGGTPGAFHVVTLVYDALPGDPMLGKLMGIQLGGHPDNPGNNTLHTGFDDVRLERCSIPAGVTTFNGSGVNPMTFQNLSNPVAGSPWMTSLDCSAHGLGLAVIFAFQNSASGIFLPIGELLVDPSSPNFFVFASAHLGGPTPLTALVPADPTLCGRTAFVQGACTGNPGIQLSNALGLTVGIP